MRLLSTRGLSAPVDAQEAVLRGIAPDGGLYIPDEIPAIPPQELWGADFCSLAQRILCAYLPGYTEDEIRLCVQRAYHHTFDTDEITPLRAVGNQYVLELFHGPTAAFKDVALSILPQLMGAALKKKGVHEDVMILTATSGDTGSAALTGFCDVSGIRVLVFYPEQGISPIQRAQMTTMRGGNLHVCAIRGNFEDAQAGVKRICAQMPADFCRAHGFTLSSANSINIGRLAPQIVYYYDAYLKLVRAGRIQMGEPVDFSVPTGNFGDILAGYLARLSGLPVGRLICASNANNVLTDFFNTAVYDKNRPFLSTTSPSMDILVSSNLERLIYRIAGDDPDKNRELMSELKQDGRYTITEEMKAQLADFYGNYASEEETARTIHDLYDKTGYVIDTHTAVASCVYKKYLKDTGDASVSVIASTASPYKFTRSVMKAIDEKYDHMSDFDLVDRLSEISGTAVPRAIEEIRTAPVLHDHVCDKTEMKQTVLEFLGI